MTGTAFIVGDLFLALVQHKKTISLAVLRSTAISHDGSRVSDIRSATIGNPEANVRLTGQVLQMEIVKALPDDT